MVRCHEVGGNALTVCMLSGPRASSILVKGSANLLSFHTTPTWHFLAGWDVERYKDLMRTFRKEKRSLRLWEVSRAKADPDPGHRECDEVEALLWSQSISGYKPACHHQPSGHRVSPSSNPHCRPQWLRNPGLWGPETTLFSCSLQPYFWTSPKGVESHLCLWAALRSHETMIT